MLDEDGYIKWWVKWWIKNLFCFFVNGIWYFVNYDEVKVGVFVFIIFMYEVLKV